MYVCVFTYVMYGWRERLQIEECVCVCKMSVGVVQRQQYRWCLGNCCYESTMYRWCLKMHTFAWMGFLCSVMDDQDCLCICCALCVWNFVKTRRCVQDAESTASCMEYV